jgi:hypothetical protein
MEQIRRLRIGELAKVAEFIDRSAFVTKTLQKRWSPDKISSTKLGLHGSQLTPTDIKRTLNGGLLTYLLHW